MNKPLTLDQKREIAGLPSFPAYQYLLQELGGQEEALLASMQNEADPGALMAKARTWQALSRIIGYLRVRPEEISNEIKAMLEDRGDEVHPYDDPMFAGYKARLGRVRLEEEET